MLTGLVFLEEGGVLNIEAGTVIRFAKEPGEDNTSALIITRGAQIFAEGTADAPIIFTAEADTVGNILTAESNQEWGGLVLLGTLQPKTIVLLLLFKLRVLILVRQEHNMEEMILKIILESLNMYL